MKSLFKLIAIKRLALHGAAIAVILLMFNSAQLHCQALWPCGYVRDFIPEPTESIKEVNIVVWKMTYGGWTPWAATDQADAQIAINVANAIFSVVPAATKTLTGNPYIQDNRIRLVLKTFTTVVDPNVFDDTEAAYTGIGSPNGVYRDYNAINIYLVENTSPPYPLNLITPKDFTHPGYGVKNYIRFSTGSNDLMSNYGRNLAHEVGHILGLQHANAANFIGFPEANCSTCSVSVLGDFAPETSGGQCGTSGVSNNLMNAATGCEWYHSPEQAAVMHYHLMTQRPNWLTPASYSAVTAANSAFDFTVTTSQTWSTPRFFKGNVTIPSGVTLSITAQVGMQRGGKFVVKTGGQLFIDHAKITNLSGQLWDGIDVEGNPSIAQTGLMWLVHQGRLHLQYATLENSVNAVRNYGYDQAGNPWKTGGIIIANDTRFQNNVRDLEFKAYPHVSASRFDECDFLTNDTINNNSAPYVHVSMWGTYGVQFNGCHFENAKQNLYPYTGQGIHSIDAVYEIRDDVYGGHTSFKGFKEAIRVANSNPLRVVNVYETEFNNNKTGIEFLNMTTPIISENQFTMTPSGSKCVALNSCTDYSIDNNNFKGATGSAGNRVGVYASMSGAGAHRIYRNDFRNLFTGIIPQ